MKRPSEVVDSEMYRIEISGGLNQIVLGWMTSVEGEITVANPPGWRKHPHITRPVDGEKLMVDRTTGNILREGEVIGRLGSNSYLRFCKGMGLATPSRRATKAKKREDVRVRKWAKPVRGEKREYQIDVYCKSVRRGALGFKVKFIMLHANLKSADFYPERRNRHQGWHELTLIFPQIPYYESGKNYTLRAPFESDIQAVSNAPKKPREPSFKAKIMPIEDWRKSK